MVPTYRSLDDTLLGSRTQIVDSYTRDSNNATSGNPARRPTARHRASANCTSKTPAHTNALRLIKTVTTSFADVRRKASQWSASLPAFSEYERRKMVLSSDNLHVEFREQYIFEGYRRPNHSLKDCLISLVRLNNNEIINFWTHFLPFLYTLYRLIQLFFIYDVRNDDRIWPMIIYMLTANLYLAASSLAHAVNCTGIVAHHICFIVDYLGISIYGVGSSIAYRAYTFTTIDPNNLKTTDVFDSYTCWAMLIAVSTNTMSSASRFIMNPGRRSFFRIFPFFLQYVYVAAPILYRLGVHSREYSFDNIKNFLSSQFSSKDYNNAANSTTLYGQSPLHMTMTTASEQASLAHRIEADFYYILKFMAALVSSFLYGLRLPERFYPRRFDIVGQSHQIFHLTTFTCTLFQLVAVEMDFTKTLELTASAPASLDKQFFTHTFFPFTDVAVSHSLVMFICLALNGLIVYYFYIKTLTNNPWRRAGEFMTFTSCCSKDYCDSCYSCCMCSCECHLFNQQPAELNGQAKPRVTFDTDLDASENDKKHD